MSCAKIAMVVVCCCLMAFANPQRPRSAEQHGSVSALRSGSVASGPRHRQEKIERAKQLLKAGSIDQAIALLREVLRVDPDNPDTYLLLGTALAMVPERSQALEALQRAVQLRPAFAPGYYTLGTVLARFAELDAAREMFEKAIKLDPRMANSHVSLALVLAQRKEFASAQTHLHQAIEIYGNSAVAASPHYLLAQVLAETNQPEKALQELETAIKLRPGYSEAYLSKGLIKKKLLDENGALQAFKKAVGFSPDDARAQHQLGAAYLRSGNALLALEHLRKACRLKPGDRYALYHLCQASRRAGRIEEAKACQKELSAIIQAEVKAADTKSGELNNEGVELEKVGNVAAALEKYRNAVELNPFETTFRRNLALALCRLGRWEEGIAELKEVLDANPEDIKATKALYIALENFRSAKKMVPTNGKSKPEQH